MDRPVPVPIRCGGTKHCQGNQLFQPNLASLSLTELRVGWGGVWGEEKNDRWGMWSEASKRGAARNKGGFVLKLGKARHHANNAPSSAGRDRWGGLFLEPVLPVKVKVHGHVGVEQVKQRVMTCDNTFSHISARTTKLLMLTRWTQFGYFWK